MAQLSYELTFEGASSNTVAFAHEDFRGFSVQSHDGAAVLYTAVADQAELHGVIDRFYTLGLELIEIRRVSSASLTSR